MTSFQKPTPPGQEGGSPEKQKQQSLRQYMTPAGEKAGLEAGAQNRRPDMAPGSVPVMPPNYANGQPGQNRPQPAPPGNNLRSLNQSSQPPAQMSPLSPT